MNKVFLLTIFMLILSVTYISCSVKENSNPDASNPDNSEPSLSQEEKNTIWLDNIDITSWGFVNNPSSTVIRFTDVGTNYVFTAFNITNTGEFVKAINTNMALYTREYSFFGTISTNHRGYALIDGQFYFVPTKRAYYKGLEKSESKYNAFYSETNFDWENVDTNNVEIILQP